LIDYGLLCTLKATTVYFSYRNPTPAKISGCFFWSRFMMLGSAESEHPRLTNREIIFEEF